MQALGLSAAQRAAYLRRLFGSHDYRIDVDILDLNEKVVGTADLLDGQVNIQPGDAIRRTCSLTVSDPAGQLDFTGSAAWSGTSVWVTRLVRVRHILAVPGAGIAGGQVAVTAFIGPPSAISRDGAEVAVECQDKAGLAIRGSSPLTIAKGTNVAVAIRQILTRCTGEFRFRLGTRVKRTSKPYSVGWADETSPWAIACLIARRELGMQLIYSCDGYVTLRKKPTTGVGLVVPFVTEEATSEVDLTELVNWVRVQGKSTSTTKKRTEGQVTTTVVTTTSPQGIAKATSGQLAPASLVRKGVARYLPLLLQDDAITSRAEAEQRARDELADGARLDSEQRLACVPFFHADVDDRIQFNVPGNDVVLGLTEASIPLGPGEMSIGTRRWVSKAPTARATRQWARTRAVTRKRKKAAAKKKK